LKDRTS